MNVWQSLDKITRIELSATQFAKSERWVERHSLWNSKWWVERSSARFELMSDELSEIYSEKVGSQFSEFFCGDKKVKTKELEKMQKKWLNDSQFSGGSVRLKRCGWLTPSLRDEPVRAFGWRRRVGFEHELVMEEMIAGKDVDKDTDERVQSLSSEAIIAEAEAVLGECKAEVGFFCGCNIF